jgi:hypothetical protein
MQRERVGRRHLLLLHRQEQLRRRRLLLFRQQHHLLRGLLQDNKHRRHGQGRLLHRLCQDQLGQSLLPCRG